MAIRVAMIGCGTVGSIHAARLEKEAGVDLVSAYEPQQDKAFSFGSAHAIKLACNSVAQAIESADVAIICSPSPVHFEQARECLDRGVHTLIELPPCENATEAEELGRLAQRRGVKLGCAHTSRFLAPYSQVKKIVESGVLGRILDINYVRFHRLRERDWTDNALLHHAAHPIDLLFWWCGKVEPKGCVALPDVRLPHSVALLGELPSGGAVTITVSYASRIYATRMTVVGEKHTIETDGFSFVKSDLRKVEFMAKERATYEEAIYLQDIEFLRACQNVRNYISWDETIKVLQSIGAFCALGA